MSMDSALLGKVGNTRGHFSKKENRAAKLISMWDSLQDKFEDMVIRGSGKTESARLAYACLIMMETGIRVGNEGSAEGFVCVNKHHALFGKEVQTFGLTTLLQKHVSAERAHFSINFTGKKLVEQSLTIFNDVLVKFMPVTIDSPDELWLGIDYGMFKKFVKRYVGSGFSPKDIRTAKVNMLFVDIFDGKLEEMSCMTKKAEKKKIVSLAIEETAAKIGHTKAVCKKSYLSSPLIRLISDAEFNPLDWMTS